jgi:acetylornithine deacetylase/succinyl-diaminopimelate desuccinylase-like protein
MQGVPGAYTAVFGPGDLAANRAHAAGEYVEVADLERYAAAIDRVLVQFSRFES